MRTDFIDQGDIDRLLAFGSSETPDAHDELVAQYVLWYGLNVSVWFAVVLGQDVPRPIRMVEWGHYLDGIGYA
jgi:hypothetical protein